MPEASGRGARSFGRHGFTNRGVRVLNSKGGRGGQGMPHPLVTQLRFTRAEWIRGLKAVTAEEAALGPPKKLPDFVGGFGKAQYQPET